MAKFIFESGAATQDGATKKAIRSYAMRIVRERQRKEDNGVSPLATRKKPRRFRGTFVPAARPLLPAIAPNGTRERVEPQVKDLVQTVEEGSLDSNGTDLANGHLEDATGTDITLSQYPLSTHHVWREQLGNLFLVSYYPDSILNAMHKDWHNFEPWDAAGATLNAARDALCLMGLGARFRDERLFDEGRKRHCVGLSLLRERIEGPGSVVCDGILDACYTLAHCQAYQSVSYRSKGWQIHIEGLYFLLRRRGVASIKSPFSHATLHKIRQIVAMDQLITRKRSFLSSEQWLMSKQQNALAPSLHRPVLQLTDMALQLSGFLKDVDIALQAGITDTTDLIRSVSSNVQSLERELGRWMLGFYYRFNVAQIPYTLTDAAEYPHFETHDMSLLFPKVYTYPTLLSATTHCYLFTLHLIIRMAQLDLADFPAAKLTNNKEGLVQEADEYASHLCRTLAYLSLPEHRSVGVLACGGPLYWASAWYERSGDSKKLQACRNARDILERECPTPLDLKVPVFTWWMIPSVFEDQGTARDTSGFVAALPDPVSELGTAS
ncbi:hypothetical protein PRZ48_004061 [Zasmidium cellare]|uniref:Uncharacterized protein n=1 Tax=Zasmidium cellare TaxID=395010 RepID=A0ABR0EY52_ZASCE|nr:hypothetical protein PRZ48_004061 [Zasmidium cellare]